MKKTLTLVLVTLMVTMSCLPVFAAADTVMDMFCDPCDKIITDPEEITTDLGIDKVIECPTHKTHDAEVHTYQIDYYCRRHSYYLTTEYDVRYVCLY